MQVLYARSHLSRIPSFRVLTRIVRVGTKIKVIKSPLDEQAVTHVESMITNASLIGKIYKHQFKVLKGKKTKHGIEYPFVEQPSLEFLIEQALVSRDFDTVHSLFEQGMAMINALPEYHATDNEDLSSYYKVFFGQPMNPNQSKVFPGTIDITAGNILMTRPLPTLIDYEWIFPFPVEREMVLFRYLWSLATRFSGLFVSYSSQFDLIEVEPARVVIPRQWLEKSNLTLSKIQGYLQKEANLQNSILEFQKDVVPKVEGLRPYYSPSSKFQHLEPEVLSTMVENQQHQIKDLQSQLMTIHHSHWWQLLYVLKNPLTILTKAYQKFPLFLIRLKSSLRRASFTGHLLGAVDMLDLSTLNLKKSPVLPPESARKVDVLIPVFNAGLELQACLESILQFLPTTSHVYLIDDLSTDPVLKKMYASLAGNPQVTVHKNTTRQGFVQNINTGFKLSKNDVIILNADTQVTQDWIEKLTAAAYAKPKVATVTPLTNNGEIVSIPDFVKPNDLTERYPLAEQNGMVERFAANQGIVVPTGVGFCMYIRRRVIDEIGEFDVDTFGLGYGEENDFCQRAIKAGYINIVDDSTFIYHKGASSFTSEEKQAYIENHLQLLNVRYPTYESQVATFIEQNPLLYMQELFRLAIDQPSFFADPAVLFVIHKNPFRVVGGVEVDAKRMLESIGNRPLFFILHRDDNLSENCLYLKIVLNGKILYEFSYHFAESMSFTDLEHQEITWFCQWLLKAFPNITTVHLEHTYGLPLGALKLFAESGKRVFLNFHDFYYFCPYEKLINPRVPRFKNITYNINKCYASLAPILGTPSAIKKYRQHREALIKHLFKTGITTFIFNSSYMMDESKRHWPGMFTKQNSKVIEPYV